jgi:hypothetical protein
MTVKRKRAVFYGVVIRQTLPALWVVAILLSYLDFYFAYVDSILIFDQHDRLKRPAEHFSNILIFLLI